MTSVMSFSLRTGLVRDDNDDRRSHVQHPGETTVQLSIHALQVRKRDLLAEDHLVERRDEVGIQEATVEDAKPQAPADELEIVQVLRVDTRRWVDLQRVVIVRRVLEQAVEGVEHLVGEQEEEFTRQTPFNISNDHQKEKLHTEKDRRSPDRPHRRT